MGFGDRVSVKTRLLSMLLPLFLLLGCGEDNAYKNTAIGSFVDVLKQNGVEGTAEIMMPDNEEIDYVATYVISAYTSTRILSFFKFRDETSAVSNLKDAMKNPKLSGQARNGTIIFAATFYPPDDEAVEKIKALFLAHEFQ